MLKIVRMPSLFSHRTYIFHGKYDIFWAKRKQILTIGKKLLCSAPAANVDLYAERLRARQRLRILVETPRLPCLATGNAAGSQ